MRIKKTNKVNLENKRSIFLEVGYIITLGLILVAFEWTSTDKKVEINTQYGELDLTQEIIPITRPKEEQKLPPPVAKPVESFKVVDNTITIEDEPIFTSSEGGEDLRVEIAEFTMGKETVDEADVIFIRAEEMPTFQGQHSDMFHSWIMQHLQYPQIAAENGISGTIIASFVIDEEGKVTQVELLRKIDPSLDNEALRVIKSSPKWQPGKQGIRPVKVKFVFSITFQLN